MNTAACVNRTQSLTEAPNPSRNLPVPHSSQAKTSTAGCVSPWHSDDERQPTGNAAAVLQTVEQGNSGKRIDHSAGLRRIRHTAAALSNGDDRRRSRRPLRQIDRQLRLDAHHHSGDNNHVGNEKLHFFCSLEVRSPAAWLRVDNPFRGQCQAL